MLKQILMLSRMYRRLQRMTSYCWNEIEVALWSRTCQSSRASSVHSKASVHSKVPAFRVENRLVSVASGCAQRGRRRHNGLLVGQLIMSSSRR